MITPKPITEEITLIEQKWGHLPFFRSVGSSNGCEWHSGCPVCGVSDHVAGTGQPDRFFIKTSVPGSNAHGYCRRCLHLAWLYEYKKRDGKWPTEEELKVQSELRRKYQEEQSEIQRQRIERLNQEAYWRGYHDAMTEHGKKLWLDEGVPDWCIALHKLGCDRGERLSIPYWNSKMDKVNTLRFKNLSGDARYTYAKGLGPDWFMPYPMEDKHSVALITEGEKKAMILYDRVQDIKYKGAELNVIATPAKLIPHKMIDDLSEYEVVLLLLDPDAYFTRGKEKETAISRNTRLIGADKCRSVPQLVDKIDDALNNGWITEKSVRCAIDRAV